MLLSCWTCAQEHNGKLIFSIKLIESDEQMLDGEGNRIPEPEIKDGVYFYLEEQITPEQKTIRTVTGYQYRRGKFRNLSGLGSVRTESFFSELDAISFQAFDFQALIEEKDYNPEYRIRGGAKYEIFIDYRGVNFFFTEWNPYWIIEAYSKKETEVKKLKEFIDRFALLYGRRQFGL